jgi:Tol biopolymer transport system component
MFNPSLSPDGQRVAVDISDPKAANVDVWVIDLKDNTTARFTFDAVEEATPVWSPDGGRIAYQSANAGTKVKETSGLGEGRIVAQRPSVTLTTGNNNFPNAWSRDGASLLTAVEGVGRENQHLALFRIGDPRPTKLLVTDGNQKNGQISPDGNWLAYASDESGESAIYVTTFPRAAGKWQVSAGGGFEPRWGADGSPPIHREPVRPPLTCCSPEHYYERDRRRAVELLVPTHRAVTPSLQWHHRSSGSLAENRDALRTSPAPLVPLHTIRRFHAIHHMPIRLRVLKAGRHHTEHVLISRHVSCLFLDGWSCFLVVGPTGFCVVFERSCSRFVLDLRRWWPAATA